MDKKDEIILMENKFKIVNVMQMKKKNLAGTAFIILFLVIMILYDLNAKSF